MYQWTCPFCDRATTITESNHTTETIDLRTLHKGYKLNESTHTFSVTFIKCPNPQCSETAIDASLKACTYKNKNESWGVNPSTNIINKWKLKPEASFRTFPNYIPAPLIQDYQESSRIVSLSPKASATLARRCLQGMIRDFWNISKGTLKLEIDALEDKIDPTTWDAIDSIRKIGNIGAHMEKDINLIVEVDTNEAKALLSLIELLFEEWYIAKHEREMKKKKVLEIALSKSEIKAKV